MEKDVTIITPAYIDTDEKARYLGECLQSCDGQARVVLVDDGSPGDLEGYVSHFPVWHYERIEHAGKSVARNRAAQLSETGTIYPLDADDVLMPGAIAYAYAHWKGIPLYSDLLKWYTDNRTVHHFCTNFSCELVRTQFLSSVNVLHSKSQWAAVGGWTPGMNLFEDWEYCGRLMWAFCGQRLGRALVQYRQHEAQSTVVLRHDERNAKKRALQAITEFIERNTMARTCCGGRKARDTSPPEAMSMPSQAHAPPPAQALGFQGLPGATGAQIVRAVYLNERHKRAGPVIYRGPSTRFPYTVQYGATVDCDISDTCTEEQRRAGASRSMLVRYPEPVKPPPEPEPIIVESIPFTPRVAPVPETMRPAPPPIPAVSGDIPDLAAKLQAMVEVGQGDPAPDFKQKERSTPPPPPTTNFVSRKVELSPILQERMDELEVMRVRDVLVASRGWDSETASEYLQAEMAGRKRKTVINLLEKKVGKT